MKKWILLLAFSYLLPLTAANISNTITNENMFNTDDHELTLATKVVKNELTFYTTLKVKQIYFLDCNGKKILTKTTSSNTVDVSNLPNGFYLACFFDNNSCKLCQTVIKKI